MIPVSRHTAAKNANTRPSIVNRIQYGLPTSCVTASNHRTPKTASPKPSAPLRLARRTLSTRSCRTIRQRVAPSDTRTPTSRARAAERASSRFATFAQAMSSTNATAPMSDRNTSRIGPPFTRSLNVITVRLMSLFVSGKSCSRRAAIAFSSLCARSRVTPSVSRPNSCTER